MAPTPVDLPERAARNQDRFREINDGIEPWNASHSWFNPEMPNWVCECADMSCMEPVPMTVEEYEALRGVPTHFLVAPHPAHLVPEVERVVARHERYWIVEKVGRAGELSVALDEAGGDGSPA
jgi:hypothetical protein